MIDSNPRDMLCVFQMSTTLCVCVWIVHSETVLFRQCWQQEVGCGFAAVSQEVADCITGGTDGGRGGEDLD